MVHKCHQLFVKTYRMYSTNPNVNYRLKVMMICQRRFTDCNKCTTVGGNVDGGDCACAGGRDIWELSVLSTQFFLGTYKHSKKIKSI